MRLIKTPHPVYCSLSLVLLLLLTACGGSAVTPSVAPSAKSTDSEANQTKPTFRGFKRYRNDPRIFYEAGGETLASEIASFLDAKAKLIETRQYSPFSKPINVFILMSESSGKRYCASDRVRGCVINQRLYVTNRAKTTLQSLVQHELSHLHLEQKLGMLRYHSQIPAWFQEGLAVFVSNGAGAERVTFSNAIQAIKTEKSIQPNTRRSLLSPKRAAEFGLKNSMFYAQS